MGAVNTAASRGFRKSFRLLILAGKQTVSADIRPPVKSAKSVCAVFTKLRGRQRKSEELKQRDRNEGRQE